MRFVFFVVCKITQMSNWRCRVFYTNPKTAAEEAGTRDRARRSVAGGDIYEPDWLAQARAEGSPFAGWMRRAEQLGFVPSAAGAGQRL